MQFLYWVVMLVVLAETVVGQYLHAALRFLNVAPIFSCIKCSHISPFYRPIVAALVKRS